MKRLHIENIHYISSGNLIPKSSHTELINYVGEIHKCTTTHSHYPIHSNYDLFSELLDLSRDLSKNDLVIVLWNNPRISNFVKFNNDIPNIRNSKTIEQINFLDYSNFTKEKEKYFIQESILLFNQIKKFTQFLEKTGHRFLGMHTVPIPMIQYSNPIDFDDTIGLNQFLYKKDIMNRDIHQLDESQFVQTIGDIISENIQQIK